MTVTDRDNTLAVALSISLTAHIVMAANGHIPFKQEPVDFLKEPTTEFIVIEEKKPTRAPETERKRDPAAIPPPYVDVKDYLSTLQEPRRALNHRDFHRETAKPELDIPLESDLVLIEHELNELKDHPAYINYYERIRETIRNNAFAKYNRRETGRVKLTFTITALGELSYTSVNSAESVTSAYLHKIALDSIGSASPFPPFPEELKDYSALTFSVTIHFRT